MIAASYVYVAGYIHIVTDMTIMYESYLAGYISYNHACVYVPYNMLCH